MGEMKMYYEQLYTQINELLRTELPAIGICEDEGEAISTNLKNQKYSSFNIKKGGVEFHLSVTIWKYGFEADKPILNGGSHQHRELMNVIADLYKFEFNGNHYQTSHQFNRYDSLSLRCSDLTDAHYFVLAVGDYFRIASDDKIEDLEGASRAKIKQLEEELHRTRSEFYKGLERMVGVNENV